MMGKVIEENSRAAMSFADLLSESVGLHGHDVIFVHL
jgi:hypothetical protein